MTTELLGGQRGHLTVDVCWNVIDSVHEIVGQLNGRSQGDILKKLKGRLFLPQQVGVEFFRHREEAIAEQSARVHGPVTC